MEDEDEAICAESLLAETRELNPRFAYLQRPPAHTGKQLRVMQIDINYLVVEELPVLLVYGLTEEGCTVMAMIHGFRPYFYAELVSGFIPIEHNVALLATRLGEAIKAPVAVEVVQRESVRGYKGPLHKKTNFAKIFVPLPKYFAQLRKAIEQGRFGDLAPLTYESSMPFVLRFMIDKGIVGMGWIEFREYNVRQADCRSWCRLEIELGEGAVHAIPAEGTWAKLAPLRVLSFDIECDCKEGFPQDSRDSVITIACSCKEEGRKDSHVQVALTLGSCSKIPGVDVVEARSEKELLQLFEDLLCSYDPDFILGYNMINFDLPYILGRAKALGMKKYGHFGRLRGKISQTRAGKYLSKAMGMRETKEIDIDGRVQLDLMIHMHKEHKLSSYSLNNVSIQFLGEKKEDVHHSEIHKLFEGTPDDRNRLAVYCVKDAELPLRLMERLMCLYNYAEMARVTGVPANYLFTRGQQIKVASQLYRRAMAVGMVIPCERVTGEAGRVMYEGAEVLDPKQGFYKRPIATLDFASLYPSIMMAHNLCYSTLLTKATASQLQPDDYFQTPQGHLFVKGKMREGLLPQILQELISARKKAKKELETATDPTLRAVLDGRQLALKISANSVYGFTGATVGQLPCLEISSTVTAIGREMILQTKAEVERRFGAVVIYGDTDSVMCDFQKDTIEEAMALGKQAAAAITETIGKPPIKLEFEKVYCPYLLIAKKRYAGLLYTRPQKHDKIDTKGIENVRRDNCPLIRNIMNTVLHRILVERDERGAADFVREKIADLLMNRVDISELIITKALTKKADD
jgi:DNA polymerase delta subunit 1